MTMPLRAPERRRAVPPLDTVMRVRKMLADLDIFTAETFYPPAAGGAVYSCRLELGDAPLLGAGFALSGSGTSPRWALASAYGELMERLCCGELLPRLPGGPGDADAEDVPVDVFAHQCPQPFVRAMGVANREELAGFLQDAYGGTLRCVPFCDVGSGEKVMLPEGMIRDLCGTTGLCAGNTRDEAILHGLMEIFERHATRKLYQYRLTPPEIPEALFEGTEVMKRLRALDLKFSIRDCALGKAYPVIGLELTQPDGRRAFLLGAAASPVAALERCLIKAYSGAPEEVERRFHRPGALEDEKRINEEYCSTISTGSGAWPDSAFAGELSYPPSLEMGALVDDAQALKHFMGVASRWGGRLYARDCSHLGFPAYRLYMPGASETYLNFTMTRQDYVLWTRLCAHRQTVCRLPAAPQEALEALASAILEARRAQMPFSRAPVTWLAERTMRGAGAWEGAFFPLLFGATGRYALAADEMDSYLDTAASHEGPRLRWRALATFWRALADGRTAAAAADAVKDRFGPALAAQCLSGFSEPASLFSPKDWPVCPDCSNCALRKRCVRPEAEALAIRLFR